MLWNIVFQHGLKVWRILQSLENWKAISVLYLESRERAEVSRGCVFLGVVCRGIPRGIPRGVSGFVPSFVPRGIPRGYASEFGGGVLG